MIDPVGRTGKARGGGKGVFTLDDTEAVMKSWHEFLSVRDREFHEVVDRLNVLVESQRAHELRFKEGLEGLRLEVVRCSGVCSDQESRLFRLESVWYRRLWRWCLSKVRGVCFIEGGSDGS